MRGIFCYVFEGQLYLITFRISAEWNKVVLTPPRPPIIITHYTKSKLLIYLYWIVKLANLLIYPNLYLYRPFSFYFFFDSPAPFSFRLLNFPFSLFSLFNGKRQRKLEKIGQESSD